jgi:hypothetical protein
MRRVLTAILLIGSLVDPWVSARATTLRKLSIDDMIQQSTAIMRVKVTGSSAAFRGKDLYTSYQLQVIENMKSGSTSSMPQSLSVAVPGGVAGGIRQMVAGAPVLASGQEYVIFLWTSKSGLTQVIGLSQGLFAVTQNSAGAAAIVRQPSISTMLNQSGQVVTDQPVSMTLTALRSEIQSVLGAVNAGGSANGGAN